METNEFLVALERDSAAFVDACEVAGLSVTVPSCQDWTVADLLWHLTEVFTFWGTMVSEHRTTWEGYEGPTRPVDEGLAAKYRHVRTELLQTMSEVDPAMSMWTWSNDKTAGF